MNSIQRVLAALTFGKTDYGKPDRVPCLPVPLMQGALVYNTTVEQYFKMPAEKIAGAQIELNKMFNGIPDAVAGIPNVIEDVTAFGIGLKYHYPNSTPGIDRLLITEYDQIRQMKAPNPLESQQLAKTRDVISILAEKIGSEKVVIGAAVSPFSLPSLLMGTDAWMRLLFTPELRDKYMHPMLEVCKRFVIDWAKAQHKAGAHVVVLADGMASATLIPRKIFQQYALPVVTDTIKQIGGLIAYEPVGRVEPFISDMADTGAVAVLIGEEDNISVCKAALRGRCALIGNVNNMKLRRWSPARVELMTKRALVQGMPGYGFALANQGPEIPFDTSVDVIGALINAVEKYGYYTDADTSRSAAA